MFLLVNSWFFAPPPPPPLLIIIAQSLIIVSRFAVWTSLPRNAARGNIPR